MEIIVEMKISEEPKACTTIFTDTMNYTYTRLGMNNW
jgi:hypothetical protein